MKVKGGIRYYYKIRYNEKNRRVLGKKVPAPAVKLSGQALLSITRRKE